MNAKHTPGPWHVATGGQQIRSARDQIARTWMMRRGECVANAHLIAAAPDLLAALQEITPAMPPADAPCHVGIVPQSQCAHCQRIARAHAAIAKATGDTQ